MRILFVADVHADPNSGAAGTEYQTIQALRRLGADVDDIWADAITRRIAHPNLHYLLELPRTFAGVIDRARRNTHYDVIHCNQPQAYLAAREHHLRHFPGVFVNRSHGFEAHSAFVLNYWRRRWNMRERPFPKNILGALVDAEMRRHCRLVVRHADGLIVSSQADQSFISEHYAISPDRVACIPQAIPDLFRLVSERPMTAQRLRNILFIGPPRFWKGPDLLGPATAELVARHPDIRLTWVCAREERPLAGSFLSAAAHRRTTFADPMSQDDLLTLYDQHGIFLFPSLFEGFGKVFLEAMSRGLCVVASNIGGMADIIRSGTNGILIPSGDVVALQHGVDQLLEQADLATRIAAEARSTALQYSWERVGQETASFYERLLQTR